MDTMTVWRDLHDPLLAFIARRVGHSDAGDVLQDVMLRIHRHEHELDHLERVTGWVYRVATNAITITTAVLAAGNTPPMPRSGRVASVTNPENSRAWVEPMRRLNSRGVCDPWSRTCRPGIGRRFC